MSPPEWAVSRARTDALVARLRAAGCVFAEEEASEIVEAAADADELERMARRRERGEPLEHVVGRVRFGALRLSVGPGVFVPRQRSLLLARAAVAAAKAMERAVVLEAFCGVAPIAASVAAAVPGAELHVADIDRTALGFARCNAPTAAAHLGDGFAALPPRLRGRLDLVAAVPPYVPRGAAALLPRDMVEHEPERALLGGARGLDHVLALIDGCAEWLAGSGRLLVELHRTQYRPAAEFARARGLRTRMHRSGDGQTVLLGASRPAAA